MKDRNQELIEKIEGKGTDEQWDEIDMLKIVLSATFEVKNNINSILDIDKRQEIEKLSKKLEDVVNIFDSVFNYKDLDNIKALYKYLPLMGIFYNNQPVYLNTYYPLHLGYEDYLVIYKSTNFQDGIAKDGYSQRKEYVPETLDEIINTQALDSQHEKAKKLVSILEKGGWYVNEILKTKNGRIILWCSFGNKDGYQLRVGLDITDYMKDDYKVEFDTRNTGISFDTKKVIDEYIEKCDGILGPESRLNLMLLGRLIGLFDNFWNNSQYSMKYIDLNSGTTLSNTSKPNVLDNEELKKVTTYEIIDDDTLVYKMKHDFPKIKEGMPQEEKDYINECESKFNNGRYMVITKKDRIK